jgi:alpha-L-arabinofuranosidase
MQRRAQLEANSVYANASFDDATGEIILKIVNAGNVATELEVFTESGEIKAGTAVCLSGPHRYAYNTIEAPDKVTTREWQLSEAECKKLVLAAESFTVYRFKA